MSRVCRGPAPAARECTLSRRRWTDVGFCVGDSLFVPSFRALDCSNFIGISGWLYRQFFTTDYIIVLKVHWLTIRLCFLITWYSSNMSCFKIFSLTSEYNSRTNRHSISCGKEETQHKPSHGQPNSTSWRSYRHKKSCLQTSVYPQSVPGSETAWENTNQLS